MIFHSASTPYYLETKTCFSNDNRRIQQQFFFCFFLFCAVYAQYSHKIAVGLSSSTRPEYRQNQVCVCRKVVGQRRSQSLAVGAARTRPTITHALFTPTMVTPSAAVRLFFAGGERGEDAVAGMLMERFKV